MSERRILEVKGNGPRMGQGSVGIWAPAPSRLAKSFVPDGPWARDWQGIFFREPLEIYETVTPGEIVGVRGEVWGYLNDIRDYTVELRLPSSVPDEVSVLYQAGWVQIWIPRLSRLGTGRWWACSDSLDSSIVFNYSFGASDPWVYFNESRAEAA